MEQIVPSITTNDLEWCANWTQDNKFYCTLFIKGNKYSKPRGFNKLLQELFGETFGGFRYDQYRNGYECWFKNKEDMLTLKLLAKNGSSERTNYVR